MGKANHSIVIQFLTFAIQRPCDVLEIRFDNGTSVQFRGGSSEDGSSDRTSPPFLFHKGESMEILWSSGNCTPFLEPLNTPGWSAISIFYPGDSVNNFNMPASTIAQAPPRTTQTLFEPSSLTSTSAPSATSTFVATSNMLLMEALDTFDGDSTFISLYNQGLPGSITANAFARFRRISVL